MKKSYVKPQVLFEDFQLSASIANGCTPEFGCKLIQAEVHVVIHILE